MDFPNPGIPGDINYVRWRTRVFTLSRGYTDRPAEAERYSLLHLVDNMSFQGRARDFQWTVGRPG